MSARAVPPLPKSEIPTNGSLKAFRGKRLCRTEPEAGSVIPRSCMCQRTIPSTSGMPRPSDSIRLLATPRRRWESCSASARSSVPRRECRRAPTSTSGFPLTSKRANCCRFIPRLTENIPEATTSLEATQVADIRGGHPGGGQGLREAEVECTGVACRGTYAARSSVAETTSFSSYESSRFPFVTTYIAAGFIMTRTPALRRPPRILRIITIPNATLAA